MIELIEPYILDSNILMQAARVYYSFDFAKPFWDGLIKFAEQKRILSIDKVYGEIMKGNDKLKDWANSDFKPFFHKSETDAVAEHFKDLAIWLEGENYSWDAKKIFLQRETADGWVIAYAKAHKCTVVTSEVLDNKNNVSIPIPNICNAFDVPYCNTFEMLKKIGFSF